MRQAGVAAGVGLADLFLPAEHGRELRHRHGRHDVARVGQHVGGFDFGVQRRLGGLGAQRLRAQPLQPLPGFGERARHLVDADQVRHQRAARLARQHMAMQLRQQRLLGAGRDRAGGDGVARPGDDGRDDQQDVVAHAVLVDLHRLGQRLGLLDQDFIGAHVALGQVVQRGFQRGILACLEQLRDRFAKLILPVHVFDAAARAVQRLGKRDEAGGVAGQAGSGLAAGSGHNFGGRPVSVQRRSLTPATLAVAVACRRARGATGRGGRRHRHSFCRYFAERYLIILNFT